MYTSPLVSIILTSYNQPLQLKRALNSILNQSYRNIEIIIVDDHSTDGISEIFIKNMASQYPEKIKYHIQAKNIGIAKNKNTGFKLASGELITYLDGDDYYLHNKIECEINQFLQTPNLDVVYSNFRLADENNDHIYNWIENRNEIKEGYIFDDIIQRDFPKGILFRCELMRASVLKNINYYTENIKAYHDWDSRIRYAPFAEIGYSDNIGSVYVQDNEGISKRMNQIHLLKELEWVYRKNLHLLVKQHNRSEAKGLIKQFYLTLAEEVFRKVKLKESPELYWHIIRHNWKQAKIIPYKLTKLLR